MTVKTIVTSVYSGYHLCNLSLQSGTHVLSYYFDSGNYYVKFGHFSGKNHVKFGNFVNFFGKCYENSGILANFSSKNRVKFGHFVNFFIHIFRAKMSCPPKVDRAPTPMQERDCHKGRLEPTNLNDTLQVRTY